MQLRDSGIIDVIDVRLAPEASRDSLQGRRSAIELLAALDAAELAGDRLQATALIEQIYAVMDANHALIAQDG